LSEPYTGGCACGAIRYRISDDPLFQNHCQCRDCQRKSGTGHGSYLTFPSKLNVTLEGEARQWNMVADSGNVKTRDDPSRYKPQAVTYRVRGYAWDWLDPALSMFDKMPSR
jgi:Glutathione-dependent formaldehyde-activating enzyme